MSRDLSGLMGRLFAAVLLLLGTAVSAGAQQATHWRAHPRTSLAWYQVNPHSQVLWATTCPDDPFWRPGEGRGGNWNLRGLPPPKKGMALTLDTIIPLYRRRAARPFCTDAVIADITVDDTLTWRGVRGTVSVRLDSLTSGLDLRDQTARRVVFNTTVYREIRFDIDSLGNIQPGDTLRAGIHGTFKFRDVERPSVGTIEAWREPAGLRVLAKLEMVPVDLVDVYGVSIHDIRLGLTSGVWHRIHFGVDAVLVRDP